MVRADLFDKIDYLLRDAKAIELPFGGIQVILFGDVFQLPPVVKGEALDHFGVEGGYVSPYFFSSRVIKKNMDIFKIFEFTKIFRQNNQDFLNLLSKCRDGSVTSKDLQPINRDCVRVPDGIENILCLTTRVAESKDINLDKYNKIDKSEVDFDAFINGDKKYYENPSNCPAPKKLRLKEGTQVLFTANDLEKRFVNGTIGVIIAIDKIHKVITVKDDISIFRVRPYKWEKIEFVLKGSFVVPEIKSTFIQFPMVYGWAMTIHRSQGKTLDKAFINMEAGTFAPGQGYVALSRIKSLEGLYLKSPVYDTDFYADQYVENFMKHCRNNGLIENQYNCN